jgi:hypothetical protein
LVLQSNSIPFAEGWLAGEFHEHPFILLVHGVSVASLERLKLRLESSTAVIWLKRESSQDLLDRARET